MADNIGLNLLIVDDEEFIMDSLCGYFEDHDFAVFCADSGEKALKIVESKPIDIVIVDLRLPGMSGDILIHNIHKNYPHIRFLIHTGSVDYSLTSDLKEIGIKEEHVYFKPVPDLNRLVTTVMEMIPPKD